MKLVKISALFILMYLIYREANSEIWQHIADKNWIADYLTQHGVGGTLALMSFGVIFTGCGGPKQLIAFTFGFAFGGFWGALLCLVSTTIGAIASYCVAHFLLKPTLTRRLGYRYQQFRYFVRRSPFSKILIIRLFPIGNNLLTNVMSGIAGVPVLPFIGASIIGYLPQTLIFSLAGAGVGSANHWQLIMSIVLGVISMLLTSHLYQKYKKSHSTTMVKQG